MTLKELAELVRQMRDAQRSYFKSKSQPALELSKRLEAQVDAAVSEILAPNLFAEESP